ncbi:MAG: YdcH family protein [Sphingopyxis sp.]|nr:YdcH family protein [Sphingopyxis sp.]
MSLNPYLFRLTQMHKQLDDAIRRESSRPANDRLRVLRLKKLKLAVKDRLAEVMRKPLRAR